MLDWRAQAKMTIGCSDDTGGSRTVTYSHWDESCIFPQSDFPLRECCIFLLILFISYRSRLLREINKWQHSNYNNVVNNSSSSSSGNKKCDARHAEQLLHEVEQIKREEKWNLWKRQTNDLTKTHCRTTECQVWSCRVRSGWTPKQIRFIAHHF